MTADDVTLTEAECNGSPNCRAAVHEHGCFADNGDCTDPADHLPDLADRLAAVQAQLDAAMLRNIEYLRRAESAERRLAEVEALAGAWETSAGTDRDIESRTLRSVAAYLRAALATDTE